MSSIGTVWRIAMREIREHGRSKSFLITTAVTFLLVGALVVVPGLIGGGTDESTVGGVGEGNEPIVTAAEQLGNASDEPDAEPSVARSTCRHSRIGSRPRPPWMRARSTPSSSTGRR